VFTHTDLDKINKEEEENCKTIIMEWNHVLLQFFRLIGLRVEMYRRLKEMGEFLLLKALVSVYQKHSAVKLIVVRLIKIPKKDYWLIRGIVTPKYIILSDKEVLQNTHNYIRRARQLWEPHEVLVTKLRTRMRFILPEMTIQIKGTVIVSFGIDVINSEVGRNSLTAEVFAIIGDDEGIMTFTVIPNNPIMSHLIDNNQEKLAQSLSDIEECKMYIEKLQKIFYSKKDNAMTRDQFIDRMRKLKLSNPVITRILRIWSKEETEIDCAIAIAKLAKKVSKNYKLVIYLERAAGNFMRFET
jgi:hypothetical protein